jgi:hypothetical protein
VGRDPIESDNHRLFNSNGSSPQLLKALPLVGLFFCPIKFGAVSLGDGLALLRRGR